MKLRAVDSKRELKNSFSIQFNKTLDENPSLYRFIKAININLESNFFIVGGYIRSIINDEQPRDLDLIVNFEKSKLDEIVKSIFEFADENRLGGYKIKGERITIDVWSINDNWAFKEDLIKNVEIDRIRKIAEGTFFNFDSLVLDVSNFNYSLRYYNACANNQLLDIVKRNLKYKRLNPTKEANILRAFYLRSKYELDYSEQLRMYLKEQLDFLEHTNEERVIKLLGILKKYQKYNELSSTDIFSLIEEVYQMPQSKKGKEDSTLTLF